jgi:hypothetical protein
MAKRKLEDLLAVVEALDPSKRSDEQEPPSDEDLNDAREQLTEALEVAATGDRPDLESARAIRAAIDAIDEELSERSETLEREREEAKKLLEGVRPEPKAEEDAEKPAGEGEEPKADEDPKPDAEKPKAEEDPDPSEATKAKEPVAASVNLADAIANSRRRAVERVEEPEPTDVLVAAVGPAQGRTLGPDSTLQDVAGVFNQYAGQVKRGSNVLVHMERVYPESRQLGLSNEENTRLIDSIAAPRAITAAGGICEPLPADFSHPICGDRGRPIRDGLPGFRADRGGIRFQPSVTVGDLSGSITVWTSDTDAAPGTEEKDCPRIECEDEVSANVDAIVACVTVGNFQARFNPEFWRSRLDLLMVDHDRIAEQTLYTTIETGSTQVTYAPDSGSVVNVLQALDKAAAGLRSRHRLNPSTVLRAIMPAWLQDALRAHLASQAPAGSPDLFAVADAQLASFFSSRRIVPIWSPDVDVFGTQADGALVDFPGGNVDIVLYPEGTWLFLDGGTLDLGTEIRDSALNAVNDRQAFMETFEQVVFRGCESLSIEVALGEDCICLAAAG